MEERSYGCRAAAVFVLINVVRERETRGRMERKGKEKEREERRAVRAGKTLARTS
jgi:hypothetical protein